MPLIYNSTHTCSLHIRTFDKISQIMRFFLGEYMASHICWYTFYLLTLALIEVRPALTLTTTFYSQNKSFRLLCLHSF